MSKNLFECILNKIPTDLSPIKESLIECLYIDLLSESEEPIRLTFILKVAYDNNSLHTIKSELEKITCQYLIHKDFRISRDTVIILKDNSYITLKLHNNIFGPTGLEVQRHVMPDIPKACL